LLGLKIVLLELLLEDGDLVVRHLDARFGPVHGGAGLFFAGADLGVVEGGDDVAGFDGIAFADADIDDASGSLGRDGGVVAFDASADGDDAVGDGRVGEVAAPDEEGGDAEDDDEQREDLARGRAAAGGAGLDCWASAGVVSMLYSFRFPGCLRPVRFDGAESREREIRDVGCDLCDAFGCQIEYVHARHDRGARLARTRY